MSEFAPADFLMPCLTYLRLARWPDSGEWVYIGPLDGQMRLRGDSLFMGCQWIGCLQDGGGWLIDVADSKADEWHHVEVYIAPANRGWEIGKHEDYLDAQGRSDDAMAYKPWYE